MSDQLFSLQLLSPSSVKLSRKPIRRRPSFTQRRKSSRYVHSALLSVTRQVNLAYWFDFHSIFNSWAASKKHIFKVFGITQDSSQPSYIVTEADVLTNPSARLSDYSLLVLAAEVKTSLQLCIDLSRAF